MLDFIAEIPLNTNGKEIILSAETLESEWARSKTFNQNIDAEINEARTSVSKSIEFKTELDQKLFELFSFSLTEYRKKYAIADVANDEGYQVLKYRPNEFYKRHVDDSKHKRRVVSGIIYLNDDYEGGELHFPFLDYKLKPKANTAVLFPSNFCFEHEACPVISGTKYAAVTWFY